jgi:hypothetical protein
MANDMNDIETPPSPAIIGGGKRRSKIRDIFKVYDKNNGGIADLGTRDERQQRAATSSSASSDDGPSADEQLAIASVARLLYHDALSDEQLQVFYSNPSFNFMFSDVPLEGVPPPRKPCSDFQSHKVHFEAMSNKINFERRQLEYSKNYVESGDEFLKEYRKVIIEIDKDDSLTKEAKDALCDRKCDELYQRFRRVAYNYAILNGARYQKHFGDRKMADDDTVPVHLMKPFEKYFGYGR